MLIIDEKGKKVLLWIIGVTVVFMGVIEMSAGTFLAGLTMTVGGLLLIPTIGNIVVNKYIDNLKRKNKLDSQVEKIKANEALAREKMERIQNMKGFLGDILRKIKTKQLSTTNEERINHIKSGYSTGICIFGLVLVVVGGALSGSTKDERQANNEKTTVIAGSMQKKTGQIRLKIVTYNDEKFHEVKQSYYDACGDKIFAVNHMSPPLAQDMKDWTSAQKEIMNTSGRCIRNWEKTNGIKFIDVLGSSSEENYRNASEEVRQGWIDSSVKSLEYFGAVEGDYFLPGADYYQDIK